MGPNRYEVGRFESEDSLEMAGGSRGTIESMHVMFQDYTRAMEMKQALILKEIKDSSAQLEERINRVEHMQEDGSESVWATTRHCRRLDRTGVASPRRMLRQ